jgi:hypothetical protein
MYKAFVLVAVFLAVAAIDGADLSKNHSRAAAATANIQISDPEHTL